MCSVSLRTFSNFDTQIFNVNATESDLLILKSTDSLYINSSLGTRRKLFGKCNTMHMLFIIIHCS